MLLYVTLNMALSVSNSIQVNLVLRVQCRDIVLSVVVKQRQPRCQVCEECRCGCLM